MDLRTKTIKAVRKNVLFQFVEESVAGKRFINSTKSGIIIHSSDGNQAVTPRWGKVTHVGPEVDELKVGEYVLIEPGKWTVGFTVRDWHGDPHRYWKTDVDKILLAADEPQTTY